MATLYRHLQVKQRINWNVQSSSRPVVNWLSWFAADSVAAGADGRKPESGQFSEPGNVADHGLRVVPCAVQHDDLLRQFTGGDIFKRCCGITRKQQAASPGELWSFHEFRCEPDL